MKKILFVANVAKEHIMKFHIPTIKALKDAGWIVDVACSGDDDIPYCDNQFKTCWKRTPFTTKTFAGVKELEGIIDNGQYDIIYCHTPIGGLIGRLAARKARKNGTKVVYFAHGFHFYKGAPIINWLVYYPIEKFLSLFTDCLITINEEDYNFACKNLHAKKIRNISGIGVNLSRFKNNTDEPREELRKRIRHSLSIDNNDIVLTYVAELIPNKNQLSLLNMLETLTTEYPNAKLMLVGPDHYNGKVQSRADEMGLADNVIFTGWRNDVPDLLAASDFAVPASIREGLGLNVIEAMAVGIPVVAYDNRGHRDIIKNGINGYIVENGNHKEMASIISMLIKNHELKEQLTNNALSSIEKYDSSSVLNELWEICNDVLNTN